jgi:hypothetical protein
MAGITLQERKDKARIQAIEDRLLAEPNMAASAYQRLNATLSGLQRVQDRRVGERQAKVKADRASRAEDARQAHAAANPWLPSNGRDIVFRPAAPVDNRLLPRPGESPAQTRARLEALAAE